VVIPIGKLAGAKAGIYVVYITNAEGKVRTVKVVEYKPRPD